MFAARITLPHFSVSSAMSLLKSAGEPVSGVPPRSASRALILGSARAALISFDFGGRVLGRDNAIPYAHLVPRHEFAHGRDVRQCVITPCGGHRQRTQLAGLNVFFLPGRGGELDQHLSP